MYAYTRTRTRAPVHAYTRAHACAYTHAHHAHARQSRAHQYPMNTPITAHNAFFAYGVTRYSTTRRKRLKTALFQPCNGCIPAMHTIGAPIPTHNGQSIGAPMQWHTDSRAHKRKTPDMPGIV